MKKLYGVIAAMVTPFDTNDEVDLNAVRKMTDFYISRGVHCLYPNGTTGEMYLMSVDERKKIAETVVDQALGRATVFIHSGAMKLKDTVELSRHAHEIGADGIGVVTPSYFGVNDREMEEYFVAVANSVPCDFPVYLYNIPQLSGNDLRPDTIEKIIVRCSNVVGIKYSYPDMLRVNEYLRINGGNFSVVIGADRLFYAGLCLGCDGLVSGISSVCPEPFVAVYNAFENCNFENINVLQQQASQISESLKNGSNMAYFKAALQARGINAGNMRHPLMNLSEQEIPQVITNLKKLMKDFSIDFDI